MLEAYEQNREAAEAILDGAERAAGFLGANEPPEPRELVLFVAVEPGPVAERVPMASGSTAPLHARKYKSSKLGGGGNTIDGCIEGCPACAAGLPDPIPAPAEPQKAAVAVAAPAGSAERAAQLGYPYDGEGK